jgi:hypothetical protein
MSERPLVLLFSAKKDYANVSYVYSEALKSVGIDAISYSGYKHDFLPDLNKNFKSNQLSTFEFELKDNQYELQEKIKKARAIIWMHSRYLDLHLPKKEMNEKVLAVFHGGTHYRQNYKMLNDIFNPIVDISLIQTYELYGLGAKNEKYLLPAIDTKSLSPVFRPRKKEKIIAHYPHVSYFKGSFLINDVLRKLKNEKLGNKFEYYITGDEYVPWKENIKRMGKCDIYIESLSQGTNIKNKHDWSFTALEAASLGKIVVTNFGFGEEAYKKEYGDHSLQVANSKEQLHSVLVKLLNMNDIEFEKLKYETRAWVEKYHSYEAIGNRLREILKI